jgi:hypothetical protein
MAFENRQKGTFVSVINGKFCVRTNESDPKATKRVNKENNTVYEIYHDSLVGKLKNINIRESVKYGKSWVFDFVDVSSGDEYHLQMSYSNSLAKAFLKMLPNIDLSKEFKLSPSKKNVDGKDITSLFINQDGQTVKHAFTKENPNGLPQMVQITVKGLPTWDDSEQLAFLEKMVNNDILPKLNGDTVGSKIDYQDDEPVSNIELTDDQAF